MPHTTESTLTERMRECVEECTGCHNICTETVQHCLSLGGEHASPEHVRSSHTKRMSMGSWIAERVLHAKPALK